MRQGLPECQTYNIIALICFMSHKCIIIVRLYLNLYINININLTVLLGMLNINFFFLFFYPTTKYWTQTFKECPPCSYDMTSYLFQPPIQLPFLTSLEISNGIPPIIKDDLLHLFARFTFLLQNLCLLLELRRLFFLFFSMETISLQEKG